MGELVHRGDQRRKWLVWAGLSIMLLIAALVFTSQAFSDSNTKRYIEYNGDTWNVSQKAKPQWFTNQEKVTFTVDLSEDYKNYQAAEAASENSAGEAEPVPLPFSVDAQFGGTKIDKVNISPVLENNKFTGQYQVAAELPAAQDGNLDVSIHFSDAWDFSADPAQFTIIKDTKTPELAVSGITENYEYKAADKNPVLTIDLNDTNYDPAGLQVSVIQDGEQINPPEIIWDNEEKTKGHMEFTNGGIYQVSVKASDKAGNESSQTLHFSINRVDPKLTESIPAGFYKGPVDVKLEDDGKIKSAAVTKDGQQDPIPVNLVSSLKNLLGGMWDSVFQVSDEGHYTGVTVVDNEGRSHTEAVSFTIDKTAPILDIEGAADSTEKKDVTVHVADGWKLDQEKTYVTVEKKSMDGGTNSSKLDLNFSDDKTATSTNSFDDGIYTILAHSVDMAGNIEEKSATFSIDNQKPKLEILMNGKPIEDGKYYDKGELSVKVDDLTLDPANTELIINNEKQSLTENAFQTGASLNKTLKDGGYTISLRSTDKLGNTDSTGPLSFVVDTKEPDASLSGIDQGAFVKNGTVTAQVTETNNQDNCVTVQKNSDQDPVYHSCENWETKGETSTLELPFGQLDHAVSKKDGHYTITLTSSDKAGHEVTKTLEFTIDATAPEISTSPSESFYAQEKTVSITIEEPKENLDLKDITIAVKRDGKDYDVPGTWQQDSNSSTYSMAFNKDDNNEGDYQIVINAKDRAGNEAEQKSLSFTIDHTVPGVGIDPKFSGKPYFNKNTSFHFNVTDRNLKFSGNELHVWKNGAIFSKAGALALKDGPNNEADGSYTFSEDGDYRITLDAADKAGNEGVRETREFIIDQTAPSLSITGVDLNPNEHPYYASSKKVSVSAEDRNFARDDIEFSAIRDGQPVSFGAWTRSDDKAYAARTLSEDGDYTMSLRLTDKAGNTSVIPSFAFTIDQTKPGIDIQGVEQDAYYNTDKTVAVTIKDRNLKTNTIKVTKDGSPYRVGSFTIANDTASLSHTFRDEGKYEIFVEAIDKAGNSYTRKMQFTIDKTKPVITPKMQGENRVIKNGEYINKIFTPQFVLDEPDDTLVSVTLNGGANLVHHIPAASTEMEYHYQVLARDKAGNESMLEISFTLDTTRPVLDVSGVIDGYFNKNMTPRVSYSDIHLDKSKTSVTLNGQPFKSGEKLSSEQDYVLKAVVTDLAGNVSSRTIVFTIDKSAPVIRFKEPISEKYFNHNLVPSLLINDMSEFDIISQTLDGEPYTPGTPIDTDGKHVLFFEVKDKAGNIKQLSVEFIIDKTAPKVIYEGVKKNKQYDQAVTVRIHLDNPEDTLKSITVNGKLLNGQKTTENGVEVIKTTLSDIKPYKIKVVAEDKAGNQTTSTIPFEIVEKSALVQFYENKPLFAGSIAVVLVLLSAGGTAIIRRRRALTKDE